MRASGKYLRHRLAAKSVIKKIIDDMHDGQKRFIFARSKHDETKPSVFTAAITHRRWGKTQGFIHYAIERCQSRPMTRAALIYRYRSDGIDVAWPIIEELVQRYNLDVKLNQNLLTCRFSNGSQIKVYGADHRFRGQKNDLILFDEAQEFLDPLEVERLIRKLAPGLADRRGRLFMVGTPGDIKKGYFYEVISGDRPEWVVIKSTPFENPHTRQELIDLLDIYKQSNPEIEKEPWIQREFYGKWVIDSRKNVITIIPQINYLYEWVAQRGDRYVVSCDWGDAQSAITLGTWNTSRYPWLIILKTITLKGGLISDHAETLKALQRQYNPVFVADPGGISKAIVRELTTVHGIPITHAEKENRAGQIKLLKTDVSLGLIKIYNMDNPKQPNKHPLSIQWDDLVYVTNKRTGEKEESKPRDIHDTVLYMRRWAAKHLFDPTKIDKTAELPGTKEFAEKQRKEFLRADIEAAKKRAGRRGFM